MLWVVPPFLALTLSLVLRLSARVKSTAAAQQASGLVTLPLIMIAYSQSTGSLYGGDALGLVHRRRRLGPRHRRPLARRARRDPRPASSASPTSSDQLCAHVGGLDGRDQLVGGAEGEAGDGPVGVADDALGVDHEDRAPVEAERAEDRRRPRRPPCRCRRAAGTRSRPACTRSRRGSRRTAG